MVDYKYNQFLKRIESDKVLTDKTFKVKSNPKYDGYQRGSASMVYDFLIKNSQVVVLNLCQMNNLQINFIQLLLKNLK